MQPTTLMARLALALGVAALASGCRGNLVASADLRGPGVAEARFTASGKPLRLWADLDGKWLGPSKSMLPVRYEIDVLQGGKSVGRVTCNSEDANTRVCGTSTNIMGQHSADCEVKMNCALPALSPGEVVLRVNGQLAAAPRVKQVNKMSLNVRED